jgi:integrase
VNRKRIRPEKVIKEGYTPEQIKICESVLNEEEVLFFRFLKYTGARLSEALTMKWDDVNYKNLEIVLRGTKTEGSQRKIDMSKGLFETLKVSEKYRTDSTFLFHHEDGSRILRKDKLFKKIQKLTGIKITAKDLRDYFASTIAMGSEEFRPDIVTVSELLGHTNLNTTKKYLFSLKDRRMKAVSVLDRLDEISTNISTGQGIDGGNEGSNPCGDWWRRRELNPGHCGYEPHALTV